MRAACSARAFPPSWGASTWARRAVRVERGVVLRRRRVGWTLVHGAVAGLVGRTCGRRRSAARSANTHDWTWPSFTGTFPTTGVATRVDGGWSITVRCGFASGIDHARGLPWETLLAEARPDDRTALLWAALPVEQACVVDGTWNVDGLRATGSRTFTVDDVFVPDSRAFTISEANGRGNFVHRLPTLVYISPEHAGVALGLAAAPSTK